ncbi:hypothetical protein DL95DRAFT_395463 [Leptodontidium sp. 2 PMI_412]|nr:hypothetical protein BKA61DRAFT_610605 [Leptodontidium sp. MPI-SDFR-AT-0119]KAH9208216.1 hypothetical protein DL95DRAFT_395463 [Leptodontidium sp. 2 PMI_412]
MRTSLLQAAVPPRSSILRFQPNNHIHRQFIQQTQLQSSPFQSLHSPRFFATNYPLQTQNPSPSPSKPSPPPNPSFGAASFKELGATRTVKIVVYIAIGIMGTVETFTWSRFLWAKFGPKKVEDGDVEK